MSGHFAASRLLANMLFWGLNDIGNDCLIHFVFTLSESSVRFSCTTSLLDNKSAKDFELSLSSFPFLGDRGGTASPLLLSFRIISSALWEESIPTTLAHERKIREIVLDALETDITFLQGGIKNRRELHLKSLRVLFLTTENIVYLLSIYEMF